MSARAPYFAALQAALRAAEICDPVLVVDRARLDANADRLRAMLPEAMGLRIAAKSLPSAPLLRRVMARAGASRVMCFNLSMLFDLEERLPEADILMGKPLPVAAAARALREAPALARRVGWLIDSVERATRYAALAAQNGASLRVALEIDIGLRRGGLAPGAELAAALAALGEAPGLTLIGVMGYEPHIPALPRLLGWRSRAWAAARRDYAAALAQVAEAGGDPAGLIRNAGGSPTFQLYRDDALANEVTVGSALVKPAGFDLPHLAGFAPACFIAAPALKVAQSRFPGLGWTDALRRYLRPGGAAGVYLHGGKWMAAPVDPSGLRFSRIVGRSSNQELLLGPAGLGLAADDLVFLRPGQSEAVLRDFGEIIVVENGRIVESWPVFPARR